MSKKIKNSLGASILHKVYVEDTQLPLGVLAMSKEIHRKTKFKEAVRACFGDHVNLTRIANEYVRFLTDLRILRLICPKINSSEEALESIYNIRDVLLKMKKECKYDSDFFYTAMGRLQAFALRYDDIGWEVHLCFDPR